MWALAEFSGLCPTLQLLLPFAFRLGVACDEWNAVGNPGVMTGSRQQPSSSLWYLDNWRRVPRICQRRYILLLDQQGERRMEDVGELISSIESIDPRRELIEIW
jgi:hypothetical protein